MRNAVAAMVAAALATSAFAQSAGGSTYPEGSNLPQRTEGQLAPNTAGQIGGSGSANTSAKARGKKVRHTGAHTKKPMAQPKG